jgi:hypothetical protein
MELMPFVLRNELGQQDISWRALEQEKLKSDSFYLGGVMFSYHCMLALSLAVT